ncbi:MAG: pantoate--beta-alanine ligase [Cellvibrionales bacterium]|jgi:pantoate--beta-alanine ligase|nr:pantoate--beta-alanine ligase [Cellvibrionales bacterium]MCH9797422.1 pantoate--beta-alanine ligase [Gammaproteobacteria bacterium]MCH9843436.1 pantoate--beta-alanine ligase [Gammaproteobacteria bacterium]MDA7736800.1 pantoate--beta-alanine ligase [Porticoccus sp.]
MHIFKTIIDIVPALDEYRLQGKKIGFVPTMGNLHDGHIELVKLARKTNDVVVCSIFVNNLQFGLNQDWDKYPRTLEKDCEKLKSVSCEVLFHPDENQMYPNGLDSQTRVICPSMTDILCGASRPGHFEGVTTVVSKLLNIIQPNELILGRKDFQQMAILRRMIEDLCFPVNIIEANIYREADGLAMSSRNSFLTVAEKCKASQLYESLNWVVQMIRSGNKDFNFLQKEASKQINRAGFRTDYISVCNSKTLEMAAVDDIDITVLGAMYSSSARLIDNISLNNYRNRLC